MFFLLLSQVNTEMVQRAHFLKLPIILIGADTNLFFCLKLSPVSPES
jgi:hypothetical protein